MKQNRSTRRENGRRMLIQEADAVLHGLACTECKLQANARKALRIVGWTEAEYLHALVEAVFPDER